MLFMFAFLPFPSDVFSRDSYSFLPPKQRMKEKFLTNIKTANSHTCTHTQREIWIYGGTNTHACKPCTNFDTAGHQCQCMPSFFLTLSLASATAAAITKVHSILLAVCMYLCNVLSFFHREFIGGLFCQRVNERTNTHPHLFVDCYLYKFSANTHTHLTESKAKAAQCMYWYSTRTLW